jgi:hypothetical protein
MNESWEAWRHLMSNAAWSDAWRLVGAWALDVLERRLGVDWPRTAMAKSGQVPPELGLASMNAVAQAALLELALRLELLEGTPGLARLVQDLRRDPRAARLAHVRLQLELAALAARARRLLGVERPLTPHAPPVDVLVADSGSLGVETFAVLRDDVGRATSRYTDELFERLIAVESRHNVSIAGEVLEVLGPEATDELVAAVEGYARFVAAGGTVPPVRREGALLTIERQRPERTTLRGPRHERDLWRRLAARLVQKGRQAVEAGATWLRVDLHDGLWQLTPWARESLTRKTVSLAAAVRAALTNKAVGGHGLTGAVFSSGALLAQGPFVAEDVAVDGARGLRRLLTPLRVRETIVVPLRGGGALLGDLYADESSWLPWALEQVDLPGPDEIFVTRA